MLYVNIENVNEVRVSRGVYVTNGVSRYYHSMII